MDDLDFSYEEETAKRTRAAILAIDKVLEKHITPLIDRRGAEFIKEEMYRRKGVGGQEGVRAVEYLLATKRLLKRNQFKGVCPVCQGGTCGDCKGKGWVTNAMYAEIMMKMRKVRG